uniref:Uncharacterized protein n=1 Tax=Mycena chlorophos TaxID=658473 RepID=A0ABQ0L4B1_MYCCL|nr:predicted protein [Mycena chlorophos]
MTFLRALRVATLFIAVSASVASGLAPISHTSSGLPIYEAPSGSRVVQNGTDMVVFAPNGTRLHVFEDVVGGRTSTSTSTLTGTGPLRPRQTASVGQVFTTFGANDTIQAFNATFVVPPPPTTFDDQFMYLSQGLMTLDDSGAPATFFGAALQACLSFFLAFGPQGGPFYTAAAFLELIPDAGYLIFTIANSTEQLNVGDTLGISATFQGVDTEQGVAGQFFTYNVGFAGPNAENLPQLVGIGQQVLPAVASFRVEEEGVEEPGDYPTGPLVFKDVRLQLTSGFPEVSWEVEGAEATDVMFEVVKDGAKDAEIKFVFPDDSY